MARIKRVNSNDSDVSPPKVRIVGRDATTRTEVVSSQTSTGITLPVRTPEPAEGHGSEDNADSSPLKLSQAASYDVSIGVSQEQAPLSRSPTENGEPSVVSDSGAELLGREVMKLIAATNRLRDLGVERFDLSLPKICVVGDQSTGKSSVIEGISGIKVPRGSGTCTRCPLELVLQQAPRDWACTISLVKKYVYEPDAFNYEGSRLGPWCAMQEVEVTPFTTVSEKANLENWLQRAQLAILNPRQSPSHYKSGVLASQEYQVPISPNVIRLNIHGHNVPNLSFFDLPGVIVQDKHQYVPQLVEALVRQYLSAPNSLILYTVAMNNDFSNSNAGALIRKIKNATDRTIGVLTKPDTVTIHSLSQFRNMLENRDAHEKMGLGYFVVKNEVDTSIPHEIARHNETEFFRTRPIFQHTLRAFTDRFGTTKLQEFLSQSLVVQIREQLPCIRATIDEKAATVENRLLELPQPPPENMLFVIHNKIAEFRHQLRVQIDANSAKEDFFNVWHASALEFRNKLVHSYPEIEPPAPANVSQASADPKTPKKPTQTATSNRSGGQRTADPGVIDLDSDDDSVAPRAQTPATQPTTPSRSSLRDISTRKSPVASKYRSLAKKFTLGDIKTRISASTRGFPGAFAPQVINRMYADSTVHWEAALKDFIESTRTVSENLARNAYESVFRDLSNTALSTAVLDIIGSALSKSVESYQGMVHDFLENETGEPLTLNEEDFTNRKHALEAEIETRCRENGKLAMLRKLETKQGRATNEERREIEAIVDSRVKSRKLEISAMATTCSYYEMAAKRFSDLCQSIVVRRLFVSLRDELPLAISNGLALDASGANERLGKMAEISQAVADERAQCEANLATLQQAKAQLEDLMVNGVVSEQANGGTVPATSGDVEMEDLLAP